MLKKKFFIFLTGVYLLLIPLKLNAKLFIFNCEPEWQSLAKEIGQDKVESFSATKASQNPHYIRAKPSLLSKIRKADLLICSGSDLEIGWLPVLLDKGSKIVQPGNIGHLMASNYVKRIEKPKVLDRSQGDIHPDGNPHIHLDPHNIEIVALEITKRLKLIDSNNSDYYQKNYEKFIKKWQVAIDNWEEKISDLQNLKIIAYHKNFSYLLNWIGIKDVILIEAKPGIAPTISHLEKILSNLKEAPADFIIKTPYDPNDGPNWVANKADISITTLPYTVGGNNEVVDLFSLFDSTINLMTKSIND